jgi:putative transposase
MSKTKHSKAQIFAASRHLQAGRTAKDVARECGVSEHTIYAWKAKCGGLEPRESQKLGGAGSRESSSETAGRRSDPGARNAHCSDREEKDLSL